MTVSPALQPSTRHRGHRRLAGWEHRQGCPRQCHDWIATAPAPRRPCLRRGGRPSSTGPSRSTVRSAGRRRSGNSPADQAPPPTRHSRIAPRVVDRSRRSLRARTCLDGKMSSRPMVRGRPPTRATAWTRLHSPRPTCSRRRRRASTRWRRSSPFLGSLSTRWPRAAGRSPSRWRSVPGYRDVNKLTNMVFWFRHPSS